MAKTSSNQRKYLITDKSPFHEKFREINFRKNLPGAWFVIMGAGLFSLLLTMTNVVGDDGVLQIIIIIIVFKILDIKKKPNTM